jgi:hypothetical protein
VVDLAGAEQETRHHRRYQAYPVGFGGVLHMGHQCDEHPADQREGERRPSKAQIDIRLGRLDGTGAQRREPCHHQPGDDPPAEEVGQYGHRPQPGQGRHGAALGDDGDHRDQEVFGEQLATRQGQRDEPR